MNWHRLKWLTNHLTESERFWFKVEGDGSVESCWMWGAAVDKSTGYGSFMVATGVRVTAHRYAWQYMHGPVPDGLYLDHLCRVRACCNPWHLDPVTPLVNVRRGVGHGRETHCPQGHPYSGDNLYAHRGRRYCRTCMSDRARAWREARQPQTKTEERAA